MALKGFWNRYTQSIGSSPLGKVLGFPSKVMPFLEKQVSGSIRERKRYTELANKEVLSRLRGMGGLSGEEKKELADLSTQTAFAAGLISPGQKLSKTALRALQRKATKMPELIPGFEKQGIKIAPVRLSKYPTAARRDLLKAYTRTPKETQQFTRGKISNVQLGKLSKDKSLEGILKRKPGEWLPPPEQQLMARQTLADTILASDGKLTPIIKRLAPRVRGVTTEYARGLQSHRIYLEKTQKAADALKARVSQIKDPKIRKEYETVLGALQSPEMTIGRWDKIVEYATAIKLSSPVTPMRAMLGNTFATMIRFPERMMAGGVDKVRAAITRGTRERFVREGIADAVGTIGGFKEGARMAAKAMRDETFAMAQSRISEAAMKGPAIKGLKGKIVRAPFRMVTAPDILLRTAGKRGNLYAFATREGLKAGKKGVDLAKYVDDVVKKPSKKMLGLAEKEARATVFQEKLEGTMASLDELRWKYPYIRLVIPFWKTPVNLFKFALKRGPGSLLLPSTRKALKAGGGESSEAIAKMITGSFITSAFVIHALEGKVQGSWTGKTTAEKDAMYDKGMQPFSIKMPFSDKWLSYRGLEPVSSFISEAADVAAIGKEPSTGQAALMLGKFVENFSEQPFIMGITGIVDAITQPERYGESFARSQIAGALIPNVSAYLTRVVDPVIRQPETVLEAVKAKVPGLSQQVPARLSAFGEEKQREGGSLQRASLQAITTEKKIPVREEMERLGLNMGFPSKSIKGRKLERDDYKKLLKVSGSTVENLLEKIINTPQYQAASDSEKEKIINKVISKVRSTTRKGVGPAAELKSLKIKGELTADAKKFIYELMSNKKYQKLEDEQKKKILLSILKI